MRVTLRRRELALDKRGYRHWIVLERRVDLRPERAALLLCDVWDRHWCRGAQERLKRLVPRIDRTARAARDRGMLVVHAPSSTMPFYANHPARLRVLQAPPAAAPAERTHLDPPLPIDGSDSSDTDGDPAAEGTRRWRRQHAGVWIDGDRDAIGDDGLELLGLYRQRGISRPSRSMAPVRLCRRCGGPSAAAPPAGAGRTTTWNGSGRGPRRSE